MQNRAAVLHVLIFHVCDSSNTYSTDTKGEAAARAEQQCTLYDNVGRCD